jgi:hypothetical protein
MLFFDALYLITISGRVVAVYRGDFIMRHILLTLLAIIGFFVFSGSGASAQATRTWVSGVGDDVNPCSRTAPCKTFAGAISKTAVAGTIDCLDPGGFGAVTITKSISIDCYAQPGGIAAPGTTGIIVNGANAVVSIRHLAIEGFGSGLNGVRILNALAVHLEDMTITNFNGANGTGIKVETPAGITTDVVISNSRITDNGVAPNLGGGIVLQPVAGGHVRFAFNNVTLANNSNGLYPTSPASGTVRGSISNSIIAGNDNGGVVVASTGAATRVFVDRNTISANGIGIYAYGSGVVVSDSVITANGTGLFLAAGGTIQTYANNKLIDNTTTNGAFTTPALQPN